MGLGCNPRGHPSLGPHVVFRYGILCDHPKLLSVGISNCMSICDVFCREVFAALNLESDLRTPGNVLLAEAQAIVVLGTLFQALVHRLALKDGYTASESRLSVGLNENCNLLDGPKLVCHDLFSWSGVSADELILTESEMNIKDLTWHGICLIIPPL